MIDARVTEPTTRIGFGRADITPPVGVELAGFGPYLRRRSTGVHGRIYARAVAVESSTGRWLLVSCDLMGLGAEQVRDVVALTVQRTGWRADDVAVHATHNHSGPAAVENHGWGEPDRVYLAQLPELIARACLDAISGARPARVSHAEVPLDAFAYNRMLPRRGLTNERALAGTWREPEPDTIDTSVRVLRVDHGEELAGFLVYYSCHPVICCEQSTTIHGDFPGEALRLLEIAYPRATGLFLQGALGNINPLYAHGPPAESLVALELFGSKLAECVDHGIRAAQPIDAAPIAVAMAEVAHEPNPHRLDELRRRRDEAQHLINSTPADQVAAEKATAAVVRNSLNGTIERLERGANVGGPVWCQALRIGPITLLGYNLEVFHGIKRRLQADLGDECLVLSTTNGWLGYAPTRDAYQPPADPYPAYEVPLICGRLPFHPGIEDDLVDAGVHLFKQVNP
ncbi:hypothetical protein G1H11_17580 [Phytoactinopolyspora alkaliphila]|uniref:Neutral/alkaline non-lysosomal ceramidase N-terminal domain-containing protein n=1 Tax=Phytoactinopolyspora alkaliphila TaxID=1783498 RepID=A0A6N9YQ25_9ACTN|nr:neutral/alkaline non-lysosomal ceramidase N-terminal domain-containing protein [Phytoactinopolyspora alkaliphila]NED97113.1 hypothetical protein [Phytoactinopolyspora alkaliphila]